MSRETDVKDRKEDTPRNPGWAGETGDFPHLTESDVRGLDYVGLRPLDGGHPGASSSYAFHKAEKKPDAPIFDGPYRERLDKILSRYPERRAALLPTLAMAQEIRGYLSAETMDEVARELGLSPAYVRGVATFYTMYNKTPVGTYLIQVCTNVCCNICGGDEVLQAFLDQIDTDAGEISADGNFTVTAAECLGACGFPTVVQINERYFENVTPEAVPEILASLRNGGAAEGARGDHAERPAATPGDDAGEG
jgi:NADH-quinone oxidoreductase E subunit